MTSPAAGKDASTFPPAWLAAAFLLGLALRLAALRLPGYAGDDFFFQALAQKLLLRPWKSFYPSTSICDYPPGYLYFIWALAKATMGRGFSPLCLAFTESFRALQMLADLATALLLADILRLQGQSARTALLAFCLYWLNPAVWINSSVWGFSDSLLALALVACYALMRRGRPAASLALWGLAFSLKFQALLLLPALLLLCWRDFGARRGLKALPWILCAEIPCLPFTRGLGPFWLPEHFRAAVSKYDQVNLKAFNFWAWAPGNLPDSLRLAGASLNLWGWALAGLALGLLAWAYFRRREARRFVAFWIAMALWASDLFPTRVHERYLFYFFPFFVLACCEQPEYLWALALASAFSTLNLALALGLLNRGLLQPAWDPVMVWGGLVMTGAFALVLAQAWVGQRGGRAWIHAPALGLLLLGLPLAAALAPGRGAALRASLESLDRGHGWPAYLADRSALVSREFQSVGEDGRAREWARRALWSAPSFSLAATQWAGLCLGGGPEGRKELALAASPSGPGGPPGLPPQCRDYFRLRLAETAPRPDLPGQELLRRAWAADLATLYEPDLGWMLELDKRGMRHPAGW